MMSQTLLMNQLSLPQLPPLQPQLLPPHSKLQFKPQLQLFKTHNSCSTHLPSIPNQCNSNNLHLTHNRPLLHRPWHSTHNSSNLHSTHNSSSSWHSHNNSLSLNKPVQQLDVSTTKEQPWHADRNCNFLQI